MTTQYNKQATPNESQSETQADPNLLTDSDLRTDPNLLTDSKLLTDSEIHAQHTDTEQLHNPQPHTSQLHTPQLHSEDTVWSLMMRAIHESILFIGVFAVLALFGSYVFTGMAGVSAALLAIVTVVLFCLSNPILVAVLSRLHLRPAVHMTWLVIGWIAKIAILIVVLLFVPLIPGFQIKLFGILIIIGAGIVLGAEIRTAMHARIPYVKPSEVRTPRRNDDEMDI